MRKEELRKLRALPATKEMMEKGKRFKKVKQKRWDGHQYTKTIPDYRVLFRVQNLSGYIKVAVFLPEDMRKDIQTPRYEIFLNTEGGEYITRELDENGREKRWLTAMLGNLEGVPSFCHWSDNRYFISRNGMNTLNRLKLENDKDDKGPHRLKTWQQEQKDNETKRREAREQEPWDEDMELIPELPKTFEEWMRKDAAGAHFIFYEYDRKGAKQGY